jgi:perosamine synthetase
MADHASARIPVAKPLLEGNEIKYVTECLETSWISSAGRFITEFEASFAKFCGVEHCIATNNGTTALHLALVAMGVGPGDEVIVPTLTYIASANAVSYCGATPVFADCDPRTMNIDPKSVAAKIGRKTKGILVVHLYGHPANMDPITDLAAQHGLFVLEDAAEAHGAEYKGRRVGSIGRCATFSFFGNKIVTTGEGGAVTTNDAALATKLRLHRGQGMDPARRYWFPVIGYNYRITNIQAALGLAQMERVDTALARRAQLAGWYDAALAPLANAVQRPHVEAWAKPSWWMYTVLLKGADAARRDSVMAAMDSAGIETRPVFYPMHIMPPYFEADGNYPVSDACAAAGINLPTHEGLTEVDVARIARALGAALA